ncbi:peptidylprolyl isomerase [Polaribacter sp.]|uniref:peptidylprolyl isomerase n=1 Tax=Polaribacter sp. TaxID=1920175 RepID=UPI003EF63F8D
MKKRVLLGLILSVSIASFSQKKDKTLVTIDGEKTTVEEFKNVYEKNLDAIDNEEGKSVNNNLDLFINYKLKVKEAYKLQLDTLHSYKREIKMYKNQLAEPYLKDTTYLDKLVKDAYYRTKNEVKAKHILIRLPKDATPKDTLAAFTKIIDIRNSIVNGGDFETIAAAKSEDKSAQDDVATGRIGNKGNLGYFSAFRMVYPFELAAYTTKEGEVSMPFRTQFGYHILKVDEFRASKGQIEVAHILITDTTAVGKTKIDEVYGKLLKNEKFENLAKKYSNDTNSKNNGGKLNRFGSGQMVQPFNDAAFALTEVNSYSKPFKTRYGWHILKLLKQHPVPPFSEMKKQITGQIKSSNRMKFSTNAIVQKLKKEYTIIENENAKSIFERKDIRNIPKDSLQAIILSINDKNITQEEFINDIKNKKNLPVFTLFEEFKEKHILTYYKENLKFTNKEYAQTIKEYEDGLLLFELMQQKIWNKSSKDTIGLQNFYNSHVTNYKSKELKEVKGEVMNDYQNFLEKNWIADLRRKSKVKVDKRQLKKLISLYNKK